MIRDYGKVETYKLYIGMNDKEKLKQLCPTEDFIEIIRGICEDFKIAFSMDEQIGGYMMANGTFITERSLVLSISGFDYTQIMKLAEDLRVKLNQESIMVTRVSPELYMITE